MAAKRGMWHPRFVGCALSVLHILSSRALGAGQGDKLD